MYTIITENDESAWEDETGILYHFPKRYQRYLEPGTRLVYYKGKITNKLFSGKRLSDSPHYFAVAKIGKVYPDKESTKGDLFATIVDYTPFEKAVLAKNESGYLETIPDTRKNNYWRDGARVIDQYIYQKIISLAELGQVSESTPDYNASEALNDLDNLLESSSDGKASMRYVTTYERDPKYRKQAIAIHGNSCFACGFNFGEFYGEYADGYIHIHHRTPVSELGGPKSIDPETDLVPLCANCHSVVHRRRANTLSISELMELIEKTSNKSSKRDAVTGARS
ncbi:HNH endonuclease [Shewanella alkalitolerans]|uniref:HNH endonuclease n=1 Tax=Shewanella alkalitolerans TaxID=2864209 RepID=UPI001C65FE4E|nr:HNH endonuclease [Shewanella alkalitolerans]QYJ96992.1 HNH endonuclease [Shewanella alkalitolerans]